MSRGICFALLFIRLKYFLGGFIKTKLVILIISIFFYCSCTINTIDKIKSELDHDNNSELDNDDEIPTYTSPLEAFVKAYFNENTFYHSGSYLRTVYVATNGDNTNNGSQSAPYETISHALSQATPGTRIIVQPGTYTISVSASNVQGSAENPIYVIGNGATIDLQNQNSTAISLTNVRYLILEGFTIQNTNIGHGINISDGASYDTPSEYIMFKGLTVRNIGNGGNLDCIKMSGVDYFYVVDSELSACNSGEAIDCVGCHNGLISGNYIHNTYANGIGQKGGSRDVYIHGNLIIRTGSGGYRAINAGGSTGSSYFRPINAPYEASNIHIQSNIIINTDNPIAFTGCVACSATQNTIVNPSWNVFRILQENTDKLAAQNGIIINNIIYFDSTINANRAIGIGPNTLPGTFSFHNNLWHDISNPSYTGPSLGEAGPETNTILGNPDFVNVSTGNYQLQPDSPAIGHRDNLSSLDFVLPDYNGNLYTQSIGAIESTVH